MNSEMSPEQVREARLAMGLTQQQLASLMGVSARQVARWETTGITETGAILLAKIMEERT